MAEARLLSRLQTCARKRATISDQFTLKDLPPFLLFLRPPVTFFDAFRSLTLTCGFFELLDFELLLCVAMLFSFPSLPPSALAVSDHSAIRKRLLRRIGPLQGREIISRCLSVSLQSGIQRPRVVVGAVLFAGQIRF